MKRTVTVEIAGQSYSLRSDADEESVRRIASHVDERLRKLRQGRARAGDTQALATLAALQIAEELFRLQAQHRALKRAVRDRSRALLRLLEPHTRT